MTKSVKNRLLYQLNYLQSIGYKFHEPVDLDESLGVNSNLPNSLDALKQTVEHCYLCELCKTRKKTVFGEGSSKAKIMFIGDLPSVSEDDMGRPFVGRSGEILTKMIENVLNIKREDVYITNVLKCKVGNKAININEVNLCKAYLLKEIELIKPKIIVTLGEEALKYLKSEEFLELSKIRGQILKFKGSSLIPTYHPSFLLRNPSLKKEVYIDMLKIKNMLEKE